MITYKFNSLLNNGNVTEDGILSSERVFYPYGNKGKNPRLAFHEDEIRITSCSAFRRLQDKAQLYPLETIDYTRTRLTHSLEVSAIASDIATEIYNKLVNEKTIKEDIYISEAFKSTTRNASLWHDIGNPPFGHFGEKTISDFYREFLHISIDGNAPLDNILKKIPNAISDLENFDGNAQSFRYAVKLQDNGSGKPLGLTYATIGGVVKYPYDSKNNKKGKFGYFLTEAADMEELEKRGVVYRNFTCNPIALTMEASDDTANLLADIEDGLKKNKLTYRYLFEAIHLFYTIFGNVYVDILKEIGFSTNTISNISKLTERGITNKLNAFLNNKDTLITSISNLSTTLSHYAPDYIKKDLDNILTIDDDIDLVVKHFSLLFRKIKMTFFLLDKYHLTYSSISQTAYIEDTIKQLDDEQSRYFECIHSWLHYIRGFFITRIANTFVENYHAITAGEYYKLGTKDREELIKNSDLCYIYKMLRSLVEKFIYQDKETIIGEIEGGEIIKYLLKTFSYSIINVDLLDDNFEPNSKWKSRKDKNAKVTLLISENFMKVYYNDFEKLSKTYSSNEEKKALDLYLKLRLVVDYVSGATDSHAKDLYSKLKGIDLK